MWVRCSPKGEIFVMYPRADAGNPHASCHLDGTYHHKSYGSAGIRRTKQLLNAAFRESEHLGLYMGHGKSTGAVCDPPAFDGLVIVEPGILGPKHGSVGIDLVAAGYEATWSRDIADRFYSVMWSSAKFFRAVLAPRWRSPYRGRDRVCLARADTKSGANGGLERSP
jgi:hypothetical protein